MDSFFKNVKVNSINETYKNNDKIINIVLISDGGVGKTSFALRLENKNYKDYMKKAIIHSWTVGMDFFSLIFNYKDRNVKLRIFDTTFLNNFCSTGSKQIFKEVDIVFLFYDSSIKYTFETIKNKKNFFDNNFKRNTIFALIRNKYDITKEEISDEEAIEFADSNNMLFFHLSLFEKNETGIKELFENVFNEYLKRKKKNKCYYLFIIFYIFLTLIFIYYSLF